VALPAVLAAVQGDAAIERSAVLAATAAAEREDATPMTAL
jgi:hypothetical protein